MKHSAALLFLLGVLGACSPARYWQPPESADTVPVIFTSHQIAAQPLVCRAGQGFVPTRETLSATPIDPELFSEDSAGEDEGEVRVRIPAGRPITLGVRFEPRNPQRGPGACTARARFTPEGGQRYQAQFVMPGSQCGLSVTDADNQAVAEADPEQPSCP